MTTLEVTVSGNIVEFAGKGFTSSDPNANNILQFSAPANLQANVDSPVLQIPDQTVTVEFPNQTINIDSIGTQGPPGLSGEELLLTKTERQDVEEDDPSAGDITIYYGTAAIGSAEGDSVWLVSRKVLLQDGDYFDSTKLFASSSENKSWTGRLSHTYT